MTDEQYEYRNRSNWNATGYSDHNWQRFNDYINYRGFKVPVPGYLLGYGHATSAYLNFKKAVMAQIDRKLDGPNSTYQQENFDFLGDSLYGMTNMTSQDWSDAFKSIADESGLSEAVPKIKETINNIKTGIKDAFVPGSSSSASDVASGSYIPDDSTSAGDSPFESYLTYLNYLKEINEANNAFNVEQAEKQMNFQREQNKILMDFNAQEAEKSRAWQTEMSNTAVQRQMADYKAAGLNPVLAASGGNGASIGSATAASSVSSGSGAHATADNLYGSAMLSMMNSAMNIAEKNASAAITANAVAARNISSSSDWNLKSIMSGLKDILSIAKGFKSIFS